MSYFVVERSGDGGGLRIPLPTAYETREAAIAALSAATSSGEVTLQGEVFIADLGSAVPVLVMAAPAPVAPIEAPAEEPVTEDFEDEPVVVPEDEEPAEVVPEDEAPAEVVDEIEEAASELIETEPGDFIIEEAEPAALDEESADEVYTSWEPIADVAAGSSTLADALKRAATTLEDDGVVAPDSVLSEAEADEAAEELPEDEETLGEPPLVEVVEGEEGSEWPWANVESYEVPAVPADDVPEDEADPALIVAEPAGVIPPTTDIEALVESLSEDAPIITSAPPEGEEVYVPHPVILGDYSDEPLETEALVEMPEIVAEAEPADLEPALDAAPPSGETEAHEDDTEEVADASAVSFDTGYAPTGDLDLGEYTCQDCVYSNTCPKVGQVTPAECGSFQWKSE